MPHIRAFDQAVPAGFNIQPRYISGLIATEVVESKKTGRTPLAGQSKLSQDVKGYGEGFTLEVGTTLLVSPETTVQSVHHAAMLQNRIPVQLEVDPGLWYATARAEHFYRDEAGHYYVVTQNATFRLVLKKEPWWKILSHRG